MSETEITKVPSQYSSVMMCVGTIIFVILTMVWGRSDQQMFLINTYLRHSGVSDRWFRSGMRTAVLGGSVWYGVKPPRYRSKV